MTLPQIEFFILLLAVLGFLLWGRLRHDLVAAGGLFAAVVMGLVPEDLAFSGFSHPAVIVVALVLIASRAFENSGALTLATRGVVSAGRGVPLHVTILGGIAAGLSAVINNVAALAMLMPIDIQNARRAGRSPRLTLMPLAFATILGGMVTLIGTPPNIIVSAIRERELGAPYQMFDFAPVGLAVAAAGLLFVALIGWRLIPKGREAPKPAEAKAFVAELDVPADSPAIGKAVGELEPHAVKAEVLIGGLVRADGHPTRGPYARIAEGDALLVEGPSEGIVALIKDLKLQTRNDHEDEAVERPVQAAIALADEEEEAKPDRSFNLAETVAPASAALVGRSAMGYRLRDRHGVTLVGLSHQGLTHRDSVSTRIVQPGDMLLLAGPHGALKSAIAELGLLPLSEVDAAPVRGWKIALAIGLFLAAIVAAGAGLLSFTTAIAIAVAVYAASGLVPAREFYTHIEWPVVVMLACLLPLGEAFDRVGGTALVADWILVLTAGQPAVVALIALMVVTMTLSDVLNNVATMVIAGPLGIAMAQKLGVNPDTFLMGTAIAASCAFLTPIGHKNNTLIMGPGGYAFRDYWRMGLPLELIVLAVSVPMLLVVWPL